MQQVKKKHLKKTSRELAKLCVRTAVEKKAEDPIIVLSLTILSSSAVGPPGTFKALQRHSRLNSAAKDLPPASQRDCRRESGSCLILTTSWSTSFILNQENFMILRDFGTMPPESPWTINPEQK